MWSSMIHLPHSKLDQYGFMAMAKPSVPFASPIVFTSSSCQNSAADDTFYPINVFIIDVTLHACLLSFSLEPKLANVIRFSVLSLKMKHYDKLVCRPFSINITKWKRDQVHDASHQVKIEDAHNLTLASGCF